MCGMQGCWPKVAQLCCVAVLWLAPISAVRADSTPPDFQAAARAYQDGQAALNGKVPAEAARLFELADTLAPSPQALRNAIRSNLAASQTTRAATLALAAQRRYSDRETQVLVRQVLGANSAKLARLSVKCGQPCALLCDGQPVEVRPAYEFDLFVDPGTHMVRAKFEGREPVEQEIELGAGERLILSLEAVSTSPSDAAVPSAFSIQPQVAARPAAGVPDAPGAPRWMFWTAAGLTAVSAGAALVSGLDTVQRHDDYLEMPTQDGYARGIQSQRRTNLLFLSTGVLGALTLGLAFFTDWDGQGSVSPHVDASLDGASVSVSKKF
jgi:hypothetical protein